MAKGIVEREGRSSACRGNSVGKIGIAMRGCATMDAAMSGEPEEACTGLRGTGGFTGKGIRSLGALIWNGIFSG